MQPTPGIPRNRRLQHHILRGCSKYKDVTLAARSPVLQMPLPQAPVSTAPPPDIAPRPPASMTQASRAPPASPAMNLIFLLTGSFQIGKFQTFHIFSNISAVKANNKVYAGLIQMILSKASNTLKTGTFR